MQAHLVFVFILLLKLYFHHINHEHQWFVLVLQAVSAAARVQ